MREGNNQKQCKKHSLRYKIQNDCQTQKEGEILAHLPSPGGGGRCGSSTSRRHPGVTRDRVTVSATNFFTDSDKRLESAISSVIQYVKVKSNEYGVGDVGDI